MIVILSVFIIICFYLFLSIMSLLSALLSLNNPNRTACQHIPSQIPGRKEKKKDHENRND